MRGLTRSLKYATFRAARVIGVCLLMAVGFVFYFTFLNEQAFTVENLVSRFPFTLLLIGNLMFMIYGMIDVATYTQLTLTYGSTRKDAAISTVYMHLLQILALEAVMVVCGILIPRQWMSVDGVTICLMSLALFFIGSGMALVIGILIHRFGKAAYIVVVIFASLSGGVVGGFVGYYGGSFAVMNMVMALLNPTVLTMAGIIWYAVSAVIFWLSIRNIEVRV